MKSLRFPGSRTGLQSAAAHALTGLLLLMLAPTASSQCCAPCPQWFVKGSAVYMDRVTADSQVLIESQVDRAEQLNADAFDFSWEAGLDLSLMRIAWDESVFEFRFLGVQEFAASTHVATDGGVFRLNSAPPIFTSGIESISARYSSDLYGMEVNYHYVTYLPFHYIFGFRYVGLDETLDATLDANPATMLYRTTTRNDLYGFQLGIKSVRDCPLFECPWLTWFAKAGVYGNDARQRTLFDDSVIGLPARDSADSVAFLGEFGLGLDVPLTECVSSRGGYRLMVFDRVALAADQLRAVDFETGRGSDDRGSPVYHGAVLGIAVLF